MKEDTAEFWIAFRKGPFMVNNDPVEGIRFFELYSHPVVEGRGNGILSHGRFDGFDQAWKLRAFLDLWECNAVPSLRTQWTRCIRTTYPRWQFHMQDLHGNALDWSADEIVSFDWIDRQWPTPDFPPAMDGVGPRVHDSEYYKAITNRTQGVALNCPIAATMRTSLPGQEAVSEPILIDPARLCIWPDVQQMDSGEVTWRWHGGIYCYKNLRLEGPTNWGQGVREAVDKMISPVVREWSQAGRFFSDCSLSAEGYFDFMSRLSNEDWGGLDDSQCNAFWKSISTKSTRQPSLQSDIEL